MPLTLLQGPAGSGKTHYCLNALRRAQREGRQDSTVLLVPAQSSYTMRGVLPTGRLPVVLGRPVLTFDARSPHGSVAGWLLREESDPWGRKLSPTEQLLILRRLLRDDPPGTLAHSARTLGFSLEVLDLFREWKEALLTPEELGRAFPPAPGRQRDLQSLYQRYQQTLRDEDRFDLEDLQWRALDHLRKNPGAVATTHFLVDLFSHFTNWQMEMLRHLASRAASVTVTLPFEPDRPWVFSHVENERRALTSLLPGGATVRALGDQYRLKTGALRTLERELFRSHPRQAEHDGSVQLFETDDPVAELEWVARRIRLLVRDEGYNYEEIAVLFRSLASSQRRVEEIFRAYGVPVFVDERQEQLHTAPSRAARLVLRLHAWRAPLEEALALFRNPLALGLREDADALELEARRGGMARAAELLDYAQSHLAEDSPLARAARELAVLTSERGPRPPSEWVAAIRRGLRMVGAEEAFRRSPSLFLRHRRAWEELHRVLDHVAAGGTAAMALDKFDEDLSEILAAGRTDDVPRVAGCVLIADVFQSRLPEVRAIFLPGLAEGVFPAPVREHALLPDADRVHIQQVTDKPLPLSLTRADEEYFLFYVAVTRASHRLFLSRPLLDRQGREVCPSYFLHEVQRVLPGLEAKRVDLRGADFDQSVDLPELDERLAMALSRPVEEILRPGEVAALVNARLGMVSRSPWATAPREGRLEELRTTLLEVAATRLEAFAECPFRHFAQHVLRVEDPRTLEFGPREDGTVLDEVARVFVDECRAAGGLATLESREAAERRLLEILAEQIGSHHGGALIRPLWRARIEMLRGALRRFAGALWAQAQEGEWDPAYLQLSFGRARRGAQQQPDEASTPRPLVLKTNGFELRVDGRIDRVDGRIDRVDSSLEEDQLTRVVDYKRSTSGDVKRKLLDGRILQIGLYRLAMEELYGKQVSTTLHFSFADSRYQDLGRQLEAALAGTPEEGIGASEFVRRKALGLAGRMAAGETAVAPAPQACERCQYGPACRIDHWRRLLEGEDSEAADEARDGR